jgi:hypothetical protein
VPDEVPIEFRATEYLKIKTIGNDNRQVSVVQPQSRTQSKTFWVPILVALLCDGGARMLSLLSGVGAPAKHQEQKPNPFCKRFEQFKYLAF